MGKERLNEEKDFLDYRSKAKYFILVDLKKKTHQIFNYNLDFPNRLDNMKKGEHLLFGIWEGNWRTDTFVLDINACKSIIEYKKSDWIRKSTEKQALGDL